MHNSHDLVPPREVKRGERQLASRLTPTSPSQPNIRRCSLLVQTHRQMIMNDEISIIEHRRRRRKQFAVSTSSLLFVFVASCYFLLGEESSNRNGGGSGALYLQNTVQSLRNGEANKDERGLQADCIDEWHLSIELDEEATWYAAVGVAVLCHCVAYYRHWHLESLANNLSSLSLSPL